MLADWLVALVRTGQEAGVTAHGGARLLAAVIGRIGAEHERQEAASFFQSSPDVAGVARGVRASRIANGHPPDRDPGLGGTTQPIWTAPPRATLLARPIRAPFNTMAP